jgi:predicted nucleic acid-binding protein
LGLEFLHAFLRRHRRIALDTCVFIYQLEANPRYFPFTDHVFSWLARPGAKGIASTITMIEVLVAPDRAGAVERVDELYALLSTYPNLEWITPSLEVADIAARLRAVHRWKTPDALLAATAVHGGATGFLTNDRAFERMESVEVLVLDQLLWTG